MDWSELKDRLQILTPYKITNEYLGQLTGTTSQNISKKVKNKSEVTVKELEIFKDMIKEYDDDTIQADVWHQHHLSITLDYYPDVFGSCGNGVFQFSTKREQIAVPKNALFKNFTPGKQYFVINAMGNSMEPVFYDNDKLIVENYDGEQIIDNKPYLFCYKDEIFIKRLAKNVDQLMIISENKDYDTRKLSGEQLTDVNIIGLVVGLMRDLR